MFQEDYEKLGDAAKTKVQLLHSNSKGYFILSILAGIYIGFGSILTFTIAGQLSANPFTKIIMGLAFCVALTFVILIGAELFTGNVLSMMAGLLQKKVTFKESIKLWLVCWIGNLVGSILLSVMFYFTGLDAGPTAEAIVSSAAIKMNLDMIELFMRAVLCNMLVCMAVWASFRCKTEVAKIVMIFLCIFTFYTIGLEHSIANMTTLSLGLIQPMGMTGISLTGYIYNLFVVTIGNMVGGICFVAIPYFLASR